MIMGMEDSGRRPQKPAANHPWRRYQNSSAEQSSEDRPNAKTSKVTMVVTRAEFLAIRRRAGSMSVSEFLRKNFPDELFHPPQDKKSATGQEMSNYVEMPRLRLTDGGHCYLDMWLDMDVNKVMVRRMPSALTVTEARTLLSWMNHALQMASQQLDRGNVVEDPLPECPNQCASMPPEAETK